MVLHEEPVGLLQGPWEYPTAAHELSWVSRGLSWVSREPCTDDHRKPMADPFTTMDAHCALVGAYGGFPIGFPVGFVFFHIGARGSPTGFCRRTWFSRRHS